MWKYSYDYSDHIEHHGIQGQKWGIRRYQNTDGSLTPEGKKHYQNMSDNMKDTKNRAKKITAASGALTGGIAAYDVAAILAGSSTILLPIGPAAVLVGAGSAYVTAKLAENYANKKLNSKSSKK